MLNIINGIIVDTFQAFRQENEETDKIKKGKCYICSNSRSKFEANGISFEKHIKSEHNALGYMHYVLKIKNTKTDELNSCELMVLKKIKDYRTDFFPIKKAKHLENVK
jgi:hypothetical protein